MAAGPPTSETAPAGGNAPEAPPGGAALEAPDDVAARLRLTAAARPDQLALIWDGGELTYAALHERAEAATAALQELEVGPGDRVALVLPTGPTFVEAAAAVLRVGAVLVPLLPGLADDELRHALVDSGAVVTVVAEDRSEAVVALREQAPELATVVVAGEDWDRRLADAGTPRWIERGPEDLAALVYTSGTTGRPRGAMLTRGNLAANQDQTLAGRFEVGEDDVVLIALPLAHIYALNVGLGAAITAGATLVLHDRFDAAGTLRALEQHRVSVVLGAPPIYVAWLGSERLEATDTSSLRLAVSGAAPLPVAVIERFAAATGVGIEEGYGLTEAGPSVTSTAMAAGPRPGSVGLALPGVELRLVDERGDDVVDGDPGEVLVRGPGVFAGYWQDPEATAVTLTDDGWLRTGDIGTRGPDGQLQLVDRLRDLIIVNGFNVYPQEVERVLLSDEAVAEAAAAGVADPLTGEVVVAHVVARGEQELDLDGLHQRCRDQLARYKRPVRIEVVAALPHTALGKVRRHALEPS